MEAIICQSIQDQRELLIEVFSRRYERVAILALPKTALLAAPRPEWSVGDPSGADRKSTRLNSSHVVISYAVLCLKKKTMT